MKPTANGHQYPKFLSYERSKIIFQISLEIFKLEVLATSRTPKNQILSSDMSISSSSSLVQLTVMKEHKHLMKLKFVHHHPPYWPTPSCTYHFVTVHPCYVSVLPSPFINVVIVRVLVVSFVASVQGYVY